MTDVASGRVAAVPVEMGAMPIIVMMSGLVWQALLFSLPPPLLPKMAQSLGADGAFFSRMFFTIASLGLMITSICSGAIVRRLGVRPMIILASVIYGVSGIVPFLTADRSLLLGSRLLLGAGCGLLTTGCTLLLSYRYSGAARNRALGYQWAISSASGLAALLIAGASVGAFGWHLPFLAYGLFALPILLLSVLGVPTIPLAAEKAGHTLAKTLSLTWPICIAGCMLMMMPLLFGSETPFVLVGIGQTAPLVQTVVLAMATIFASVGSLLFSRVQGGLGVRQTFFAAILGTAIGAVLLGVAPSAWVAGVACAIAGLGIGLYIPHLWVLPTTLESPSMQAHAIGLLNTSMYLGGFLYPILMGGLQKAFGINGALVAVGALLALASAGILMAPRTRLADGVVTDIA